jgi:hypothetical protein
MKCAVVENLVLVVAKNDTLALEAPNGILFALVNRCGSSSGTFCDVERCLCLRNWDENYQTK